MAMLGDIVELPTGLQNAMRAAAKVLRELPHLAGNLVHDAHTAILMREHGIRQICTRDTDFNQFSFLEIIDPLRP